MAKRRRRSFGKLVRVAVKDVVMPTSMGLGLALGGCGSGGDKSDVPIAIMPPSRDAGLDTRKVQTDVPIYAIMPYAVMPPAKDAAADTRKAQPEVMVAIMPPRLDAAADSRDTAKPSGDAAIDSRDTRPDATIYAILPYRPETADSRIPDRPDTATPDTRDTQGTMDAKPPKEVGPIYAILPLAVMPPNRG